MRKSVFWEEYFLIESFFRIGGPAIDNLPRLQSHHTAIITVKSQRMETMRASFCFGFLLLELFGNGVVDSGVDIVAHCCQDIAVQDVGRDIRRIDGSAPLKVVDCLIEVVEGKEHLRAPIDDTHFVWSDLQRFVDSGESFYQLADP